MKQQANEFIVSLAWQKALRLATSEHSLLSSLAAQKREQTFARFCHHYCQLLSAPRKVRLRLGAGLASAALALALSGVPMPAHAATITVAPGAAGVNSGDGCSLVEAIINAQSGGSAHPECAAGSAGPDTIVLSGNTYSYDTVFGQTYGGTASALPTIASTITIEANGATIRRNSGNMRILDVGGGAGNLTLNNAIITGGNVDQRGGAILNSRTLTVNDSTISNSSGNFGGGIYNFGGGTLEVNNSTISGNSAITGGGIENVDGTVVINDSTITGNVATSGEGGGGIYLWNTGTSTLNRTIVSGNMAAPAAEIRRADGTLNLNNSNVLGHSGLTNAQAFGGFTPGASDVRATSNGNVPTALTSILNTTLAENGGPTLTHALVSGSPAINLISTADPNCNPGSTFDQRGAARAGGAGAGGSACDAGAFEFDSIVNIVRTVTNTNDSGAGSLRAVVAAANSGDSIDFAPGLSGQTITLTSGEIIINKNLTIDGSGLAQRVAISGNNNSRIFYTDSASTISISSLRFINGSSNSGDPAANSGDGGAIYINGGGSLHIESSELMNNQSGFNGGAIYVIGTDLTLINNTFAGNSTTFAGGAIRNDSGVRPVLLEGNTFSGNFAEDGSALWTYSSSAVAINNTFNDNFGSGAVYMWRPLELINNTFVGIDGVLVRSSDAVLNMRNNIIGRCQLAQGGSIGVNVNNWVREGTCSPAYSGNPYLAPRADNGGLTETAALLPFSAAVNAANSSCPASDQRGVVRAATCDLGAYEVRNVDHAVDQCHANLVQGQSYSFGATGILLRVDTLGSLSEVCARLVDGDHPNALPGLQTGRYWTITPTAASSNWSVSLSAPATFPLNGNSSLCRYTGAGQQWDCDASAFNAPQPGWITRSGVQQLSDWAVGDNVTTEVSISGTLSGLLGDQVVLQNNGGDNLIRTANGGFTFATPVPVGSNYDVSVLSQPANPSQTCTVSNGSGTAPATDVTNVTVNCVTDTFQVSATVAAGMGDITPASQFVPDGGTATFSVNPSGGWSVGTVSGDTCTPMLVSGNNWQATNIQDECAVQASFVINTYVVMSNVGSGDGSITPVVQVVDHGSNASFTVTPAAGWSVASVNGNTCTPINTVGVQWVASDITEACAVTANFAQDPLDVTAIVATGQGTITPPSQNVNFGGTASFTVTPETGWSVNAVIGDTCSPAQVAGTSWEASNIQSDCAVEASFVINTYVVMSNVGSGDGSITPVVQVVDHGSNASFTVTPVAGWSVTTVVGDTCSPINTAGTSWEAANITQACSVTANFAQDTFDVSATVAAGQGTITPPTQNVAFDGTATFTVTPDIGWSVDSVIGNTCTPAQIAGTSWEASNIQDDCAVEASFVINTYTVTAAVGAGEGSITPPSQNVDHGDDATFTVTPDLGWSVTTVSGDTCSPELVSGNQWVAPDITEACAVTANFAQDTFDVSTTVAAGQGTITPPTQNVAFDGTATFTVTPDLGWSVDSVIGNTCTPAQIAGTSWEASNIQDDCAVEASFVINTYTVTAAVGTGEGSITPPSQNVDHGDDATFTVTPDTGWLVTAVLGDTCTPVNVAGTTWEASNITDACSVTANFAQDTVLQVLTGSGQVAAQGSAFAQPLVVRVTSLGGEPLADVEVAFTVPANGASALLAASSGVSNAQGVVQMQATANLQVGSYQVQALIAAQDAVEPVSFSLENRPSEALLTPSIDAGREFARYGQTINYLVRVENEGSDAVYDLDIQVELSEALDQAAATWLCLTPLSGCAEQGSGALSQSGLQLQAGNTLSFLYSVPVRLQPSDNQAQGDLFIEAGGEPGIALGTSITLVVFRNGVDDLYADGAQALPALAPTVQRGALEEDQLVELLVPASTLGHWILWQSQDGAALPVRVEQLCTADGCWLRMVASESGTERSSPWTPWRDAAVPLLSHSTVADYQELLLDAGGGMVALRIRRD